MLETLNGLKLIAAGGRLYFCIYYVLRIAEKNMVMLSSNCITHLRYYVGLYAY